MRRDGVIYTPNQADKQRYASDRLNVLLLRLLTLITATTRFKYASAGPFQSGFNY